MPEPIDLLPMGGHTRDTEYLEYRKALLQQLTNAFAPPAWKLYRAAFCPVLLTRARRGVMECDESRRGAAR